MDTNTFYGAIVLLTETPKEEVVSEMSADIAELYFPGIAYKHHITKTLPESTPVHIYDQYTAEVRDLGDEAVFLVVEPTG